MRRLLWLCGARSDGGARAAGSTDTDDPAFLLNPAFLLAGSTDADNPAFLLPMMLDGVPVSLPLAS